jgi:hypothetical protein
MNQFVVSLTVTVLIGAITAYQTYLTRKQLTLQTESMGKNRKQKTNIVVPWRHLYGPPLIMVLLAAASWIPYLLSANGQTQPNASNNPPSHLFQWGPLTSPARAEDIKVLLVKVHGSDFKQYAGTYKLAGLAFHYSGEGNILDLQKLQKSALYEIENQDMEIFIPLDQDFITTMQHAIGTNYRLLLVPSGVSMDQFSTLRQAALLGIKQTDMASGGP